MVVTFFPYLEVLYVDLMRGLEEYFFMAKSHLGNLLLTWQW